MFCRAKKTFFYCRYSDVDPNLSSFERPCNHNTKSLKCNFVKRVDIKKTGEKFYEEPVKTFKRLKTLSPYISKWNEAWCPSREQKTLQNPYNQPIFFGLKGKKVLPVCRGFFLAAFGIFIQEYAKNLPASESHYNRKKSCRVYLSNDLNIATLFKMHVARQNTNENPAKLELNSPLDIEALDTLHISVKKMETGEMSTPPHDNILK